MSTIKILKVANLSPSLRRKIFPEKRKYRPRLETPVSNYLVHTKRHCNGGRVVDAGLFLRDYCNKGGKIFLSMAGAGSSFELGVTIGELIRAGKIAGISVTGANMEESVYRLIANSYYAKIPDYEELRRKEEMELERADLPRITDTFLPEQQSVRMILPKLEKSWRESEITGKPLHWHEHFFRLFERKMIKFDRTANPDDCWLYQAWQHNVAVFVPGFEDSTMGNIFSHYTYDGDHPFLSKYKLEKPISREVVLPNICYMHRLAEWYMDTTKKHGLVFVQLGGGIAGDFAICVVPHLKKDFMINQSARMQDKLVRAWEGFIEVHSSPMSYGSYSGAGHKEKFTWSKLQINAFGLQICGDYTAHFPDMAALALGK